MRHGVVGEALDKRARRRHGGERIRIDGDGRIVTRDGDDLVASEGAAADRDAHEAMVATPGLARGGRTA